MAVPPQGPASRGSQPVLAVFLWAGLATLVAVMIIASAREPDTDAETVATAGPTADEIAAGQTALASVGCYAGAIDGRDGEQTTQAVRDFQAASGIAVDGIFGPATFAALDAAVAAGQTVCAGEGSGSSESGGESGSEGGGETGSGGSEGEGGGGSAPEGTTRVATLTSAGYGPTTFTVTSWDCTGDAGDLTLTGTADGGLTLTVMMNDGAGTLAVEGGDEQDGITLNGTLNGLSKSVGAFEATGTFDEPNFAGEEFDLAGTC